MTTALATMRTQPELLSELSVLGDFKGLVMGLQPQTSSPSILVLDMGCAEVSLVMKSEYFGSGGYAADDFFGLDANQPMEPPATAGVMNVVSFVSLHCYYSSHVCMQMECLI